MPVYRNPHTRKLPKRSRSRPIHWRGEAAGRFFRCWNCGFVCDSNRDQLGGSNSASGNNHVDYALQAGSNYRAGGKNRPVGTLDVLDHFQIALKKSTTFLSGTLVLQNVPDLLVMQSEQVTFGTEQIYFTTIPVTEEVYAPGDASFSTHHYHKSNITAGCPFCGCTNWRGDY